MSKCKKCGKNLTNVHPDLAGVLCIDCREHRPMPIISPQAISSGMDNYSTVWRNLTREQIQALRDKQQGKCAICGHKRFLVLDHDHKTGKARGYLCRGCNTKLSGFDNPVFADKAREYLKNPPANNL